MPSAAAALAIRTAISPRLEISRRGWSATLGCSHAPTAALWRPPSGSASADVPGSDQKGPADDDLAAIRPEGSPSSAGISLDAKAVMDLRVVPFAQQG